MLALERFRFAVREFGVGYPGRIATRLTGD